MLALTRNWQSITWDNLGYTLGGNCPAVHFPCIAQRREKPRWMAAGCGFRRQLAWNAFSCGILQATGDQLRIQEVSPQWFHCPITLLVLLHLWQMSGMKYGTFHEPLVLTKHSNMFTFVGKPSIVAGMCMNRQIMSMVRIWIVYTYYSGSGYGYMII